MPCLASWIEKKFLSGPPRSPTATILPLRSVSLSTPELTRDNTRMQPPWVPAAILTSNPCSSGFSQRNAMPTPASLLPVAIASSN